MAKVQPLVCVVCQTMLKGAKLPGAKINLDLDCPDKATDLLLTGLGPVNFVDSEFVRNNEMTRTLKF